MFINFHNCRLSVFSFALWTDRASMNLFLYMYLFTDRCMQSWNTAFFFYWLFVVKKKKTSGSGRVRALNLTVPLGSGRVGSDDLGYGPGPCRPLALVRLADGHSWAPRSYMQMEETYRRTNITATLHQSGLYGSVAKLNPFLSEDTWKPTWN